jgi:hypothetical protein
MINVSGWGWFVVLGCFLMNLIVNGISYSFGVIFMELLENYERTSAEIAWVYSLNCVTCSWLGNSLFIFPTATLEA